MTAIPPISRLFIVALLAIVLAPACQARTISLDGASVDTYFSPDGGAAEAAARIIDSARHRVLLASYTFNSTLIASALKRAHGRGLEVRVVLDASNLDSAYSGATFLANAGVDVRIDSRYPIMHSKFIVADDLVALGSMNFTFSGDRKNAENFNVFRGASLLADEYVSRFDGLYAESRPYTR
jgi:phosphatidylserine/phosphatidylglycerophosphate/cardiolipin synthase-like enzyme